jgi:hypothetical protein
MGNIFKNPWYSTRSPLLALMLLGAVQASRGDMDENILLASGCDELLRSHIAKYDVYRNGKLLGTSTSELSRDSNGHWLYQVSTRATKGLGGLLGGQIHESARFTVVAGMLQPEHYDLSQKVAFSKVKRTADFDWKENRARGKNKRKNWQLALQGDESDRLSANIRIRMQLATGKSQLSFKTVEKGKFKVRDFEAREAETVVTGMGEMLAIPVHRKHSTSKRTTVTWHAPQLGYLPVRIEHAKKGKESGRMILKEFQQQECSTPATGLVTE